MVQNRIRDAIDAVGQFHLQMQFALPYILYFVIVWRCLTVECCVLWGAAWTGSVQLPYLYPVGDASP